MTDHQTHEYAFDVKLFATIRVRANTEAEARAMMREHIHCADTNFGAWPNGDPILGEASVEGDFDLIEINGEEHEYDPTQWYNIPWCNYQADFDAMTDEELAREVDISQARVDEEQDFLDAYALWDAAGRPRRSSCDPAR